MPKIRVELEVIDSKYCDDGYTICPMCLVGDWRRYHCAIFGNDLEIDLDNGFCIRCEQCKQAEVEE